MPVEAALSCATTFKFALWTSFNVVEVLSVAKDVFIYSLIIWSFIAIIDLTSFSSIKYFSPSNNVFIIAFLMVSIIDFMFESSLYL